LGGKHSEGDFLDERHAERTPGLANGSKAPLSWTSVTLSDLSARSGRRCAPFAVAARIRHLVTIGRAFGPAAIAPVRITNFPTV